MGKQVWLLFCVVSKPVSKGISRLDWTLNYLPLTRYEALFRQKAPPLANKLLIGSTVRHQFPSQCFSIRPSPISSCRRYQGHKIWEWANLHLRAKARRRNLQASQKGFGQDVAILRGQAR